jgi:hypothetical protein
MLLYTLFYSLEFNMFNDLPIYSFSDTDIRKNNYKPAY